MKKIFLKLHRILGLSFGVFISAICLSGSVLLFQDELNLAANRIDEPQGAQVLSAEEMVSRINARKPDSLTLVALHLPIDGRHVAEAQFAELGRNTLAVNPYTGDILGNSGSVFVGFVKKFHRWLLMPPKDTHAGMSVGRVIVGSSAIAFTLILVTGIVIWIPRNRKILKSRLKIRTGKGVRWFVYDSHLSLGIYAALFLLAMSLTGPIFSFGWYRSAATALAGGNKQEMFLEHENHNDNGKDVPKQVTIVNPAGKQDGQQEKSQGKIPVQVIFTQIHTGQVGGVPLRICYLIAALIGAALPWSGYYMFWRRKFSDKIPSDKKHRKSPAVSPRSP